MKDEKMKAILMSLPGSEIEKVAKEVGVEFTPDREKLVSLLMGECDECDKKRKKFKVTYK